MAASSDRALLARRVEALIRVMAPFLDAALFVGDRLSRLLERDDPDYVAPRTANRESPPHAGSGLGRNPQLIRA